MRHCRILPHAVVFLFLWRAPHLTAQSNHWAFQAVTRTSPPQVNRTRWCRTPIDRFILARLEQASVTPSPQADPRTLVRRISFDLVGLPPSPAEVDAFVLSATRDPAAAVGALVDRLLASPHYGERWGRWWLDVARYADSNGQDENKVMANAWRYRDWVVRAFNTNKPFDAFVIEQLAGDLLPPDPDESVNFDRWTATGFLVLGPKMLAEQDKPKLVMDIIDEQIDTVGRTFLGLTLGCARCHDHKFDPVPTRDYYAMAGIFKSTRTMEDLSFVSKFGERRISPHAQVSALAAHEQRMSEITNRINAARLATNKVEVAELEKQRDLLASNAPPAAIHALAVTEDKPVDVPVHVRGSHLQLAADPVPRGVLQVITRSGEAPSIPPGSSGRLELARWLTDDRNPLTARVTVNRIWQAHFGEGLVRTPDNFGLRGESPTHPELLDWLAAEFIRSGWDLKAMHRLILTSAVYQQCSAWSRGAPDAEFAHTSGSGSSLDPDNRLLWHFSRPRLEAEMIRDALLAVSGRLDCTLGGSLVAWKNNEYVPGDDVSAGSVRRTLYLPVVRDRVFDVLTLFDFANPSVCSAKRTPTIVSHQALFFLNSPMVRESANAIASRLLSLPRLDDAERIREAYERVLSRPAKRAEIAQARDFLRRLGEGPATQSGTEQRRREDLAAFIQVLFASNEFVYRH